MQDLAFWFLLFCPQYPMDSVWCTFRLEWPTTFGNGSGWKTSAWSGVRWVCWYQCQWSSILPLCCPYRKLSLSFLYCYLLLGLVIFAVYFWFHFGFADYSSVGSWWLCYSWGMDFMWQVLMERRMMLPHSFLWVMQIVCASFRLFAAQFVDRLPSCSFSCFEQLGFFFHAT